MLMLRHGFGLFWVRMGITLVWMTVANMPEERMSFSEAFFAIGCACVSTRAKERPFRFRFQATDLDRYVDAISTKATK